MSKDKISHEELLRVLDYSPETGAFTWKVQASTRALIGGEAGSDWGEYREEASAAYLAGAKRLFGDFARAA